ncbi:phage portal protein [Streptomyces sp. NPDC059708]|uniref:phage portal protein n=1 Tax=Streptomyces sp. NPDC059708 TaxID=3346916 RepID=UPI0036CA6E35
MDERVKKRLRHGLDMIRKDDERLERIDRYARGRQAAPFLPRKSNPEFRDLAKRAINNLIPLIVDAPVNAMNVDGYKRSTGEGVADEWKVWSRNRLDERQSHVHRAALETGQAFVSVLPDPADPGRPAIRGHHPITFSATYRDPAFDQFPIYTVEVEYDTETPHSTSRAIVKARYIDSRQAIDFEFRRSESEPVVLAVNKHGLGVCPVVRFAPQLDLRGRTMGLIEPIMTMQDRINQVQLNQLIAQHYTSFAIRYATGLAPVPLLDENGNEQYTEDGHLKVIPPVIDPSTMLVSADPNTKFGSIDGASTKDMQDSIEQAIRHMCMVTQTPPTYLLGQMANLSADALAASEQAFMRRVSEIQSNFGEAWALVLRLCALIAGDRDGFEDQDSLIMWADKGNRSLAQSADAGLKLTQMGVPPEIVLRKMPGFTESDIEEAVKLMEEQREEQQLIDKLTAAMSPPKGDPNAAGNAAAKKPSSARAA